MSLDHPIILFDGVCGLCNRFVRFVTDRDSQDRFRFATLQGRLAAEILSRHGRDSGRLETVYVVLDPGGSAETLLSKARAVLFVLKVLGGPWAVFAPLSLLPDVLLNPGYDAVARLRYRLFGKSDSCPLPNPSLRHKFLDPGSLTAT